MLVLTGLWFGFRKIVADLVSWWFGALLPEFPALTGVLTFAAAMMVHLHKLPAARDQAVIGQILQQA